METLDSAIENTEKISIYRSAELLRRKNKNTKDLVLEIGKFIIDHSHSLERVHKTCNIIESRFTPPEEAFEKGMLTCGAIANISAEMLRHVGIEVRLIHGECKETFFHAWISVHDPETDMWTDYDLTKKDGIVPATHIKKMEVYSFDEIKDQLIKADEYLKSIQSNGSKHKED